MRNHIALIEWGRYGDPGEVAPTIISAFYFTRRAAPLNFVGGLMRFPITCHVYHKQSF